MRAFTYVLVSIALTGCGRSPDSPIPASVPPPTAGSKKSPDVNIFGGTPGDEQFDLKAHPDAQILHPLDPASLTDSERKFGVAPKRDPAVQYQPDIILMEHGDKAIRSIAADGLNWTFGANSPQVDEFQEGKIVFATSRAVGRILVLKRQGDNVQVILGPVQLTDVIRNGSFAMNDNINYDTMLRYDAPEWPQPQQDSIGAVPGSAPIGFRKFGAPTFPGGLLRTQAMMPGVPGLNIPRPPVDVPPLAPPAPTLNIQDVRVQPIASNSGIGVQYYYSNNGLGFYAGSLVSLSGSQFGFFLKIVDGKIINCGIQILAAAGIKMSMDSYSLKDFTVNFKKQLWVPVDFSIPLGGPVPFAINFDTGFDISTGFSAKSSKLTAEGDYGFSGGVVAGMVDGSWTGRLPGKVTAHTDIGRSTGGISVGINSLMMAADVRTTVGIGAFGFTTGVYGNVRFSGTMLRAPDIAFPCKQGTVVAYVDSGVGYSIPGWAKDAVNFFLSFVTKARIEKVGSVVKMDPPLRLFHGDTQVPSNCASPAAGATTS